MGFLKPDMPVVDFAEWSKGTRSEKIRPMAEHWAEVGFGTPVVMHLFYVVKILLYVLGGWLFALATNGIDGFTNVAEWWTEPIVFQKVVLYTMLFEVIGLGCGFGPLNNRFFPPLGSILYWLRPNTIRLPPWPKRIPLTKGTARTPLDAALYGALLVVLLVALFSNGTGPVPALGTTVGVLPLWQIWTSSACSRSSGCGTRWSSWPPAARYTRPSRWPSCSSATGWTCSSPPSWCAWRSGWARPRRSSTSTSRS